MLQRLIHEPSASPACDAGDANALSKINFHQDKFADSTRFFRSRIPSSGTISIPLDPSCCASSMGISWRSVLYNACLFFSNQIQRNGLMYLLHSMIFFLYSRALSSHHIRFSFLPTSPNHTIRSVPRPSSTVNIFPHGWHQADIPVVQRTVYPQHKSTSRSTKRPIIPRSAVTRDSQLTLNVVKFPHDPITQKNSFNGRYDH